MQSKTLCVLILTTCALCAQSLRTSPRKLPTVVKPECAQGAICFSGEVREGESFRKALNTELDFVLRIPGGIDVVSKHAETKCNLSLWIANPPLMAQHSTEIDAGYEWTADQEMQDSVREFNIVESCDQFLALYDSVYGSARSDAGKYFQNINAWKARGRLWITGSTVTHSREGDNGKGALELLKFSVEIKLPSLK